MKFDYTIGQTPSWQRRLRLSDFYFVRLLSLVIVFTLGFYTLLMIADHLHNIWVRIPSNSSSTKFRSLVSEFPRPSYDGFSYYAVGTSFKGRSLPLYRLEEIQKDKLHQLIIETLPVSLQSKLNPYLQMTLNLAEKYQVDPFWAIAVMWTESHFNIRAISRVNAIGLMQIMPGTGHYISMMMDRPVAPKVAYELIKEPKINIEMGIYYLRYLLRKFKGSYRYATVAYNMGPSYVKKKLRAGHKVGENHQYLKKVTRYYHLISKEVRSELRSLKRPYLETFVFNRPVQKQLNWKQKIVDITPRQQISIQQTKGQLAYRF